MRQMRTRGVKKGRKGRETGETVKGSRQILNTSGRKYGQGELYLGERDRGISMILH